jgi:hypothetical protein
MRNLKSKMLKREKKSISHSLIEFYIINIIRVALTSFHSSSSSFSFYGLFHSKVWTGRSSKQFFFPFGHRSTYIVVLHFSHLSLSLSIIISLLNIHNLKKNEMYAYIRWYNYISLNIIYAPNGISYKYASLFIYICWRCMFSSSFRLYFIVAISYFFFFFFSTIGGDGRTDGCGWRVADGRGLG